MLLGAAVLADDASEDRWTCTDSFGCAQSGTSTATQNASFTRVRTAITRSNASIGNVPVTLCKRVSDGTCDSDNARGTCCAIRHSYGLGQNCPLQARARTRALGGFDKAGS